MFGLPPRVKWEKMDAQESQHKYSEVQIYNDKSNDKFLTSLLWHFFSLTNQTKWKIHLDVVPPICSVPGGQLKGNKHIRARKCTQHLQGFEVSESKGSYVWYRSSASANTACCVCWSWTYVVDSTVTGRCTMWEGKKINQKNFAPVEKKKNVRRVFQCATAFVRDAYCSQATESKSNTDSTKDEL